MYSVIFQSRAEKFLKKLDGIHQKMIVEKLKELEQNPELGKPLTGNLTGLWSLRIGDYRTIYQIKHNELIILILKIGHRKNVYD
jgi:mRNA interferase RelE/StbE